MTAPRRAIHPRCRPPTGGRAAALAGLFAATSVGLFAACSGPGKPPTAPPGDPPPTAPPSASSIESLVLSATGGCGVLADHTARCWGVWEGSMIKAASAASGLRDITELRIGHTIKLDPQRYYDHFCARDVRNTVQCWGNNQQHQLGADVSGDSPTPTPLDLSGVTQLALGAQHACALDAQGSVWCWG
ncbi:MAG TPA: hypothetical protein VLM79_38720, partial [Kofleriaceae bacterium]|nr:hypothetical protein [Kofleriaceae bacterium]